MTQKLWTKELSHGLRQLRQDNGLSRSAVMGVLGDRFDCHLTEGRLAEVENCRTSTSDFTSPSPAFQDALAAFYADPKAITEAKSRTGGSGGSHAPTPASARLTRRINGRKNGGS